MFFRGCMKRQAKKTRGFTLVELAIVLGVASLLFAGLWRLMASGNAQLRDQTAADQHRQIIAAVSDYLADPAGQAFLLPMAANETKNLPMDTIKAFAPETGFDNFTKNSYGQIYTIQVKKDAKAAGTAPNSYSFMIVTTGGETIPDTSGGRISSMIGGDGGFIYTANVCGAFWACGSYDSWKLNPVVEFAAPNPVGHIASRTYVTGSATSNPWLARTKMAGAILPEGGATITDFNTIQTNISLGGKILYGKGDGAQVGGSIENIQKLTVDTSDTGLVKISSSKKMGDGTPLTVGRLDCDESAVYDDEGGATCGYSLLVNGGQSVTGLLVAARLYARQFIYNTTPSDKRLKHEIKPIENALEKVASLKGYSFFIKEEEKRKYGVIAQDVQKLFPELVNGIGQGFIGVDYMGLFGPVIAAISEIKEENDKLKNDILSLKKEITEMKEESKKAVLQKVED